MFASLLRLKRGIKRLLKVQAESRQTLSRGPRPRFWRVLVVISFASGVAVLSPSLDPSIPINLPRAGDIAPGTIVTSRELILRKTAAELTAEQAHIRSEIPPILDLDTLVVSALDQKFDQIQQLLAITDDSEIPDSLRSRLSQLLNGEGQIADLLLRSRVTVLPALKPFKEIIRSLHLEPGLLPVGTELPSSALRTIIVRRGAREEVISRERVVRTETARQRLVERVSAEARFEPAIQGLLIQLGLQLLTPSLTLNSREHEARIQYEIDRLDSIARRIPSGVVLIRAGAVVSEEEARTLAHYLSVTESDHHLSAISWQVMWLSWLARWLLVALTAIGLIAFLRRFRREVYRSLPKLVAIFLCLAVAVAGAVLASEIAPQFQISSMAILPVALLAILVTMLVDTEVALLATVCLAILFGLLERFSFAVTLHTVLVGTITAFLSANIRRRSDAFRVVLLVALVTVLSLVVIRLVTFSIRADLLTTLSLAFGVSIVLSLFAIFILVPIAESLFGFTTDIRLLELTDLNHPVLKRLAVEAPGTYHHSLQVSTLSESAAKAIGANVLLTRAGALFHDIGKIEIPEYFVENQLGLKSRHEHLTPTMSALILASHVKRGRKLGEEADLPDDVLNFIEEHHGTMVMSYFYKKAQEQNQQQQQLVSPSGEGTAIEKTEISDLPFRYPGPKPQSRETGIVMLADAVEASSRTLDEPKPARIESLIQRIVADRFASGELDSCPLTLRDLARIRQAFVQVVIAAFHQRVQYPRGIQPE